MPEQYFDLYSTTVAIGGYTAGSGVLNVAATSPISLGASDSTRLLVYRLIAGVLTPIVLLKATAVNSSTQFAVTAEGTDANALLADVVINVNTVGAMNQFRIDASQTGTYASLPSTTGQKQGNRYKCTDSPYEFIFDGSVWQPYWGGYNVTLPIPGNFSWQSQGSATVDTTTGQIIVSRLAAEASFNIHAYVIAAPATPYHVIMGIVGRGNNNANKGACVCFSDGTKYEIALFPFVDFTQNNDLVVFYNTNNTTNSSTPLNDVTNFVMPACYPGFIFVRLGDDGTTNKTFDIGPTPTGPWQTLLTQGRTTNLTPSKVGIYINGGPTQVTLFHLATTA